jgi:DNA polymerase-1
MCELAGFDIETTGLRFDEKGAKILTAVYYTPDKIISAAHASALWEMGGYLKGVGTPRLAGQNILGFDVPWWQYRVQALTYNEFFDTQVAQSLIDENTEDNSLLGNLKRYYPENPDIPLMEEMKKQRKSLGDLDLQQVVAYNRMDSRASYDVAMAQKEILVERKLWYFFVDLMDIGKVLANMMTEGVLVDKSWAEIHAKFSEGEVASHLDNVRYMADEPELNLDSPKQLVSLMFDQMQMPIVKKTKTGQPSTSSAALKELKGLTTDTDVVGFLESILSYREHKKLLGTYYEPMRNTLPGKDGRVRTTYHLGRSRFGGTVTGRLSSSNPNLQNIPRSKAVKGMFIPSYNMRMYDADYSQIELRVAAWYSEEESMLEAFASGHDIHTATLADMEGVTYQEAKDKVDTGEWSEKRSNVKRVNFLILYGGGPHTLVELSRDVGAEMTYKQASKLIARWMDARPDLAKWIEQIHDVARYTGVVQSPTGRVRHLPDAQVNDARALRQSVNFLVQSFASDIMLFAMREVDLIGPRLVREHGALFNGWHRPLMTVHDSVIGEYFHKLEDAGGIEPWLQKAMVEDVQTRLQHGYEITGLPLAVDITTGMTRWGE